jgi:rRNA-processing protein FCF1
MTNIERMAWDKTPLPKDAPPEKTITYCVARVIYELYNSGDLKKEDAQAIKLSALMYMETLKELSKSNTKIIKELAKATAPRSELVRKDKAELLEVINRIEGVVTGLMNKYDGKVPEFLKAR